MDKVKLRKLRGFLLGLDEKIKEMKTFLSLEMGDLLLSAITSFEEENAEFLQHYTTGQEELNKRKQIIQCLLFPILSDDKIKEILEYHILEPIDAGLDLEELMKMRALTTPELLWPKISQGFLKALTQNSQIIGSTPLVSVTGDSMLPQIKNWIAVYNRRFGIEKHEGLEPHQFILEDSNTQKLLPKDKERLLKVLKFYEGLKVYSLSEIETELRKIKTNAPSKSLPPVIAPKPQKTIPTSPTYQKSTGAKGRIGEKIELSLSAPSQISHDGSPDLPKDTGFFQDKAMEERIKITGQRYDKTTPQNNPSYKTSQTTDLKRDIISENIGDLLVKYPNLNDLKITKGNIRQNSIPLGAIPNIKNWIDFYQKECGKGNHSPQVRNAFIERLKSSQNTTEIETQKLEHIFRSLDDKSPLPYDKISGNVLFNQIGAGEKLKINKEEKASEEEEEIDISPEESDKKRKGRTTSPPWDHPSAYSSDLEIELVGVEEAEKQS